MNRYDMDMSQCKHIPDKDGYWCKWADVAELTAERNKYKAALERITIEHRDYGGPYEGAVLQAKYALEVTK